MDRIGRQSRGAVTDYGGEISGVNTSYNATHKLNPYPALSKVPPFEVHFERRSVEEPWGFGIRQVAGKGRLCM